MQANLGTETRADGEGFSAKIAVHVESRPSFAGATPETLNSGIAGHHAATSKPQVRWPIYKASSTVSLVASSHDSHAEVSHVYLCIMLICCYRTKGREGWHESLPSWQLLVEVLLLRLRDLRYTFFLEKLLPNHMLLLWAPAIHSGVFDVSKNAVTRCDRCCMYPFLFICQDLTWAAMPHLQYHKHLC